MERDDRLLPPAPVSARQAAALRLGLHPGSAHAIHAHAEDLLDRLAHLRLVGALVHPERVLVRREQRVALLGDDRPDDHLARVHFDAAFSVRRARAASEITSRAWPITSATPTASACMTLTSRMLRKDLTQFSSPSVRTRSTRPPPSSDASASTAALVDGVSKPDGSIAAIEPR